MDLFTNFRSLKLYFVDIFSIIIIFVDKTFDHC